MYSLIKVSAEYPSACWRDESGLVRNLGWGGSPSRNAPQLAVGCFTCYPALRLFILCLAFAWFMVGTTLVNLGLKDVLYSALGATGSNYCQVVGEAGHRISSNLERF